jgi:hypothetical protein
VAWLAVYKHLCMELLRAVRVHLATGNDVRSRPTQESFTAQ